MSRRALKLSDLPPEMREQLRQADQERPQKRKKPVVSGSERIGPTVLLAARAVGLPDPLPEHRFHPTREWRFDWAFAAPDLLIAVEYEGVAFQGPVGRHQRAKGLIEDSIKYNEAVCLGWAVIRLTTDTHKRLVDWLARAAALRRGGE